MRKILKTTAIQNELLINYSNYNISDQELICLCQLLTFDPIEVNFLNFLKQSKNSKPIISSLVTKNIVSIKSQGNDVIINLENLYDLLNDEQTEVQTDSLTSEQIDKIVHIFGRRLNPNELMQINSWVAAGASYQKITDSIYIALGKGISNLNYIEKIIVNSNATTEEVVKKESSVKRNWTY